MIRSVRLVRFGLFAMLVGVAVAFGVPEPQGCGGEAVVEEAVGQTEGQAVTARCSGQRRDLSSDASHCGTCNHSCLGGTCKSGQCQPFLLTNANTSVLRLAVEGNDLYFVESYAATGRWGATREQSRLKRISRSGGAVTTLVSDPVWPAPPLAVDASYVYFQAGDQLNRVPRAGGAVSPLASVGRVMDLFLTSTGIYVADDQGSITLVSKSGGNPTTIVNRHAYRGYAYHGTALFAKDSYNHQILSIPLTGGAESLLTGVNADGRSSLIWANSNQLFWTTNDGIYWMPTTGGQAPVQVYGYQETDSRSIYPLALDANYLYWIEGSFSTNKLMRKSLSGGAKTVLASFDRGIWQDMQVDSTAIYLAQGEEHHGDFGLDIRPGAIWKLAK